MRRKVLAIGGDPMLLQSRVMVLRSKQYEAISGLDHEASELLERESYDLLVVCSSLAFTKASELIRLAKQEHPKMPILRLVLQASPPILIKVADEVVIMDHLPMTWIGVVDRLLSSVGPAPLYA